MKLTDNNAFVCCAGHPKLDTRISVRPSSVTLRVPPLDLERRSTVLLLLLLLCHAQGTPSNIRKEKYCPATTTTPVSRSGDPPWILKRGGLESSGRIPSS